MEGEGQRGRREAGNGKQSRTEDGNGRSGPPPGGTEAALPGITEIVFKALSTLNVRRAETLPRFTNSVIYLQD